MDKLPVLMYHSILPGNKGNNMCVGAQQIEAQFEYLSQKGYSTITAQMLGDHIYHQTLLPPKPVLVSFDDGYRDNFQYLAPLLLRFGFKITLFVVPGFASSRSGASDPYMNVAELRAIQSAGAELAFHTFEHQSYAVLSQAEIRQDLCKCKDWAKLSGLDFTPALAYTYGAYPRKKKPQQQLVDALKDNGIRIAFRIGNRLNPVPVKDPYFIQRIDITGADSLERFKRKLSKGGRGWF